MPWSEDNPGVINTNRLSKGFLAMNINLPSKRTYDDTFSQASEQAQKKAEGVHNASLMHLPADLLELEIIPRLQGNHDGSLAAFAMTSSLMRAHSMNAVGTQLFGPIKGAFNCGAFDVDPLNNAHEGPSAFPLGKIHPGTVAYSAFQRLEELFVERGVITQQEIDHPHRLSGSIADSLKVVEQAFSQFSISDKAARQPLSATTVACLRDLRAYMQHPLDAWVSRTQGDLMRFVADGRCADEEPGLNFFDTVAELKNMTMDWYFLINDDRGFPYRIFPPLWIYGANINKVEISLPLDVDLAKALGHLPILKSLTLYRDVKEKYIDIVASCLFDKLENLVIKSNTLTALPNSLAKMTSLNKFSLSSPLLENVDILNEVKPLRYLEFTECSALKFIDSIFLLKNLEVLRFNHCDIDVVPHSVSGMSSLRALYVDHFLYVAPFRFIPRL